MAMRPTLITNPTGDAGFLQAVERAVEEADGDIGAAQLALRSQYPQAVLRARDISGETIVVWYAYRDGSWVSG
jgi:hypothetical protein